MGYQRSDAPSNINRTIDNRKLLKVKHEKIENIIIKKGFDKS